MLEGSSGWLTWAAFFGVLIVAAGVLAADISMRRKRLDTITAVYFGTIIGLIFTYVFQLALTPLVAISQRLVRRLVATRPRNDCLLLLHQHLAADEKRFSLHHSVRRICEGSQRDSSPTCSIPAWSIDGRIADIVETRVIDNQLIMPQFVIAELQAIADSNDKLKRNRGRRGLDILNRLRSDPKVDLMIYDRELPEFAGQPVDQKLVLLAKHLEGKVVTNDYNLNKVAKLHNVGVINLNDIANSLKPVFLPGEGIDVRIVKAGEEAGQGVGYLEDGTMVVIEGGRDHIGEQVFAVVTSVLQTSAGRMVFGRYSRASSGAA